MNYSTEVESCIVMIDQGHNGMKMIMTVQLSEREYLEEFKRRWNITKN